MSPGPDKKRPDGARPKAEEKRTIALNRKARHDYHVEAEVEAGIVLIGTEVKSLRDAKAQIGDAYAVVERGECLLYQLQIAEYDHRGYSGHEPRRARKLLLHKREIEKLGKKSHESGYTLIPLELYFRGGRVKVRLGLCRGKKDYDKREAIKDRDLDREVRRRVRSRP